MSNPLEPSPSLLAKLGSIIVHADELISPSGHLFDKHAMLALIKDPDVAEWMDDMTRMAILPVKRGPVKRGERKR